MYVPIEQMPENSRVWIYQSNREFETDEVDLITNKVKAFLNNWKRHGNDLKASYCIKYNHFIMLLVDEAVSDVSGCAIDASVNLVKNLEETFKIDLTNKLKVTFKDHDNINVVDLTQFKKFASEGKINDATIVFNNLITNKAEIDTKWEVPAELSWHKRFIK